MLARKLPLALFAAAVTFAGAVPAAHGKAYDVHIFKVTRVSLTGTVKYDVVPTGAGLTEHLVRTTTLSGKPGGRFRIGPEGRNVAFFRENVSSGGNFATGPVSTVFAQKGSYTLTREDRVFDANDNPHNVIVQESAGNCDDRRTGKASVKAVFRVRARKLVGLVTVPTDYPNLKDCQGTMDSLDGSITSPTGIPRSRAFSARTLKVPISYRKATGATEDGATVSQVVTWKGTVTLSKVKKCPFRRGGNQFGCAGGNPDSL
jgi:hypothetical protein